MQAKLAEPKPGPQPNAKNGRAGDAPVAAFCDRRAPRQTCRSVKCGKRGQPRADPRKQQQRNMEIVMHASASGAAPRYDRRLNVSGSFAATVSYRAGMTAPRLSREIGTNRGNVTRVYADGPTPVFGRRRQAGRVGKAVGRSGARSGIQAAASTRSRRGGARTFQIDTRQQMQQAHKFRLTMCAGLAQNVADMYAHRVQREEFALGNLLQRFARSQPGSDDAFLVGQSEERCKHAGVHDGARLGVADQHQRQRRSPRRTHRIGGGKRGGDERHRTAIARQIHPRTSRALHAERPGGVFDEVAQRGVVHVVSRVQHAAIQRQTVVFCRHRACPGVGVFHAHGAFNDHHAKVERIQPSHADRGKFVQLEVALLHARGTLQVGQYALQAGLALHRADFRRFVVARAQSHRDAHVGRVDEGDGRRSVLFRGLGTDQLRVLAEGVAVARLRAVLAPARRNAMTRRVGVLVPDEIMGAFGAGVDGEQGQGDRHLRRLKYRLVNGIDESMELCVIR
ncbi:hypothetical protein COLO4_01153 [Corchorus olitorius]|uniref:Uncharacterized protein n=1 Tax=Corchorus olitorius TaxID=93759 RepID=A0A1R3L2X2_9ROSI|nr:hypothetical protein COLO4_01153 [Corchorus olitorius]